MQNEIRKKNMDVRKTIKRCNSFYGKDLNNYITKTISKAVGFLAIGLIEKIADMYLKQRYQLKVPYEGF